MSTAASAQTRGDDEFTAGAVSGLSALPLTRQEANVEARSSLVPVALPEQGCLLGIDAGERRVGVAVSDAMQLLATPLMVLQRGSRQEDFQRLGRVAAERKVVGLVVGHPLNADGSEGPQAKKVARYAWRLAAALQLPLALWDEFGSTEAAQERLAHAGRRRARRPLDAEAAAVILQDYLDQRRGQLAPAGAAYDDAQTQAWLTESPYG